MNKQETKAAIVIMQAYVDGAEIEYAKRSISGVGKGNDWDSHQYRPNFDWHIYEYRVKPKPRDFWIAEGTQKYNQRAHMPAGSTGIKVREVIE